MVGVIDPVYLLVDTASSLQLSIRILSIDQSLGRLLYLRAHFIANFSEENTHGLERPFPLASVV